MAVEWAEDGAGGLELAGRLLVLRPGAREADPALAARARQGDRAAFTELYRRYRPTVRGVLLASVPCVEVGDLVQEGRGGFPSRW